MGKSYDAVCGACGRRSRVSEGGGFHFETLFCDKCGRSKAVDRATPCGEVKPFKARCRCGGRFDTGGRPRCPACGSADLREAEDPRMILYD
jgi:hypothetical protein